MRKTFLVSCMVLFGFGCVSQGEFDSLRRSVNENRKNIAANEDVNRSQGQEFVKVHQKINHVHECAQMRPRVDKAYAVCKMTGGKHRKACRAVEKFSKECLNQEVDLTPEEGEEKGEEQEQTE